MKTIQFTADADYLCIPPISYRKGEIHTLRDDLAARWIRRGVAVYRDPPAQILAPSISLDSAAELITPEMSADDLNAVLDAAGIHELIGIDLATQPDISAEFTPAPGTGVIDEIHEHTEETAARDREILAKYLPPQRRGPRRK